MNQKGFSPLIIILGIILVIGIAGGAYYLGKTQIPTSQLQNPVITSQTPQSTPSLTTIPSPTPVSSTIQYNWPTITASESATWKSYTKYGFTLKYPPDWREDTSQPGGNGPIVILTSQPSCPPGAGCGGREGGIYIYLEDSKKKLTSKDYINQYLIPLAKLDNDPGVPRIISNQPSYFSGIDATIADGFSGAGSPGPVAFIFKRAYMHQGDEIIELFSDGINNDTVSKIFSSFKFTQ